MRLAAPVVLRCGHSVERTPGILIVPRAMTYEEFAAYLEARDRESDLRAGRDPDILRRIYS